MRRFKKKTIALVAAAMVVAMGGIAYAFWTNSGSGSGQATTGTNTSVVVNQTSTITGLVPGQPAQTLSGNFDNPNNSPVFVNAVTAVVSGTDQTGCDASDYTVGGAAPVGAEIPAGSGVGSWSGLTIQFNDKPAVNQDACKNATVSIQYTAN